MVLEQAQIHLPEEDLSPISAFLDDLGGKLTFQMQSLLIYLQSCHADDRDTVLVHAFK